MNERWSQQLLLYLIEPTGCNSAQITIALNITNAWHGLRPPETSGPRPSLAQCRLETRSEVFPRNNLVDVHQRVVLKRKAPHTDSRCQESPFGPSLVPLIPVSRRPDSNRLRAPEGIFRGAFILASWRNAENSRQSVNLTMPAERRPRQDGCDRLPQRIVIDRPRQTAGERHRQGAEHHPFAEIRKAQARGR